MYQYGASSTLELSNMKTIEQQVEEVVDLKFNQPEDEPWLINVYKKTAKKEIKKALQERDRIAREEERESLRQYVKNEWVFPPPNMTVAVQDKPSDVPNRAELPAEYVRRMVLTSLIPNKQRIVD